MGGGTTGISILKDGKVIYTDDEATGGSHMTMTVAGHYKIPYEEAEILKTTPEKEDEIFPVIKATIEKAPPEIAADVAENGLVLSGGSSLLRNLDKVITKRTGMQVTMAENPLEGVVLGAAKALEDVEKLKIYIKKSRR